MNDIKAITTVLFQLESAIILTLLYIGLYFRKNKTRHVPIMKTVIIWDILLILQIELSRGAINKAQNVTTNPLILTIHVSLAVFTVLCYIPLWIWGQELLAGNKKHLPYHKRLGQLASILRSLTLVTSYWAHDTTP